MKTCIGFMFWGVLLIALDFKVKHVDYVPDFVGGVGYALVAIGTGGLAPMTANFVAACTAGWLLVVLYAVAPYLTSDIERPFEIVVAVLNGTLIWTTLAGIGDIALGRNRPEIARRAVPLRSAYVALVALSLVLGQTLDGSERVLQLLTAALIVIAIVTLSLILLLLYRAWGALGR